MGAANWFVMAVWWWVRLRVLAVLGRVRARRPVAPLVLGAVLTLLATPVVVGAGEDGRTILISRAHDGGRANSWSLDPSVSGDGRLVAFDSYAKNLVPETAGGHPLRTQVFVRDVVSSTTVLVSSERDGSPADDGASYPTVSRDGRFVVFGAYPGENLVSGEPDPAGQVYARDVRLDRGAAGAMVVVSASADGTPGSNGSACPCAVSPDGRYVVFHTLAPEFIGAPSPHGWQMVWVDRDPDGDGVFDEVGERSFELISASPTGEPADRVAAHPSMTPDGRYVVFESAAWNLAPVNKCCVNSYIYLRDRVTQTTVRVPGDRHVQGSWVRISDDGRLIAFNSEGDSIVFPGMTSYHVMLFDTTTKTLSIGSRSWDGRVVRGGGADISPDGRFLVFYSPDDHTAECDGNGQEDIYVRDLQTGEVMLASVADDERQANRFSIGGRIAQTQPDSINALAFMSTASNLTFPELGDGSYDIYLRTWPPRPPLGPHGRTIAGALDQVRPGALVHVPACDALVASGA